MLSSVNGVWEEWTEASTCTVTCGGGNKTYSRKCIKPQHGGNLCEGDAGKIESCGEQECPGQMQLQFLLIPIKNQVKQSS